MSGMDVGSATADPASGAITGTGMAKAIADQLYLYFTAGFTPTQLAYQSPIATPPNAFVYKVGAAQNAVGLAGALAAALVPYIQANAVAHVTTQSLGFTPSPNNPLTPLLGPVNATVPSLVPVDIPIQ